MKHQFFQIGLWVCLLSLCFLVSCTVGTETPGTAAQDTVQTAESVTVESEPTAAETQPNEDEPPAAIVEHAVSDRIRQDILDWLSDETAENIRASSGDAAADAFCAFAERRRTENAVVYPTLDGDPIPLRKKEGFSEISLFSAELYNRPWIWYHCEVDDIALIVKIMYIDDAALCATAETDGISAFVRTIAPTAPNVDNYTTFENYEKIETMDVAFRDFTAQVMVSTPRDHDRYFYTFVYDDILVGIQSNRTELLDTDLFQRLSFDAFALTK